MQAKPKNVSPNLVSFIRIRIFQIKGMNPFVEYFIPKRDFNCEAMIIIDVPDVNALVIGIEIKSTRNPLKKWFVDFEAFNHNKMSK